MPLRLKWPRKEWGRKSQRAVVQTVQRLSSNVEGRYQKYARIGALTMVPLGCEPTISNIKEACKRFFKAEDMDCDILAGERGPSWTETSQISNWKKALHVRLIERSEESQMCGKVEIKKQLNQNLLLRNQPDRCQQELSPLFHLVLC